MNITKKRLLKIKKTKQQSKKRKKPKYKKKQKYKKRRSFRKRKKNNIRKKSIKNIKSQKGGAIRKITPEETMFLNDTVRRAGAGINQIFQYYDKFYLKVAMPQVDRDFGSYSTNAAFTQIEYIKNYNIPGDEEELSFTKEIKDDKLKNLLLSPIYFGKKLQKINKNQIEKMPKLWQFLNSMALVIENKTGTKTKNVLTLENLEKLQGSNLKNFFDKEILKDGNRDAFNNLTLYGFKDNECVPIWNIQKNPFKEKNKERLKELQNMFDTGAGTGANTGGGQKGGGFNRLREDIKQKQEVEEAEKALLKDESVPDINLNDLPKVTKLRDNYDAFIKNTKQLDALIEIISKNTKGIDEGKENKFQSAIKEKQKLAMIERDIKQDLIDNSPLSEEEKNAMKKKVGDEYSKTQNKILSQKQKHDYARANKEMGVGAIIPRTGPVQGQGTFSTDNYFKPSTNKMDPNDSDFMPKPIKTWGIQMDPQKNGLFAHINIRPNHPYQLDKENIVINKFLKHDVPEWLQFVGDSLKDRHQVDGFDGTPWHWPHNDKKTEEAGKAGEKGDAPEKETKDEPGEDEGDAPKTDDAQGTEGDAQGTEGDAQGTERDAQGTERDAQGTGGVAPKTDDASKDESGKGEGEA